MSTMYFGPPSLRKDGETQIETPIGRVCTWCDEPVVEGDYGVINRADQLIHYECMIRSACGSVGHQMHKCSCYGGTEEDPTGMTKREAAKAAAAMLHASIT